MLSSRSFIYLLHVYSFTFYFYSLSDVRLVVKFSCSHKLREWGGEVHLYVCVLAKGFWGGCGGRRVQVSWGTSLKAGLLELSDSQAQSAGQGAMMRALGSTLLGHPMLCCQWAQPGWDPRRCQQTGDHSDWIALSDGQGCLALSRTSSSPMANI